MKLFLLIVLILVFYGVCQYARTQHYIRIGVKLANEAVRYEQHPENPRLRILTIGDSSVVGTGASDPRNSVAGRLGHDFPNADILNKGVNGTRTHELIKRLKTLEGQKFDLIVLHTGGNDIVHFTPLAQLEKDLPQVLDLAKSLSDTVVLLHGGNVGTNHLFPWETRWLFTRRTAQVRSLFMPIATEKGVHYVDMWRLGNDDPFYRDPKKYYAPDFFHPSDDGYGDWYEQIQKVLDKSNI